MFSNLSMLMENYFMEEKDTITQNEETNINADGDTLDTTNSSNESIDNTIEKIQETIIGMQP